VLESEDRNRGDDNQRQEQVCYQKRAEDAFSRRAFTDIDAADSIPNGMTRKG
jgi:hypothetical protein